MFFDFDYKQKQNLPKFALTINYIMKTGLLHLHNFLGLIVLAVLLISVILFLVGFIGKKPISKLQQTLRLIAVISTGLQLILGFIVYFYSNWHHALGEMKDANIRKWSLEHPIAMTVGIILVHIGSAKIKRALPEKQNKTGLLFFGIAFILILSQTPWNRLF